MGKLTYHIKIFQFSNLMFLLSYESQSNFSYYGLDFIYHKDVQMTCSLYW